MMSEYKNSLNIVKTKRKKLKIININQTHYNVCSESSLFNALFKLEFKYDS